MKNKQKTSYKGIIWALLAVIAIGVLGLACWKEMQWMGQGIEKGFAVNDKGISVSVPTLKGQTWVWEQTQYSDGTLVTANYPGRSTLTFGADGMVAVQTDCNKGSGTYQFDEGDKLVMGPLALTRMFCLMADPASQESEFTQQLAKVSQYRFANGNLILEMQSNSGTMTFSPAAKTEVEMVPTMTLLEVAK